MIELTRFVARSQDRDAWLEARATGVTATMVAEAASGPAGFRNVIERRNQSVDVNAFMSWGTLMEPEIAQHVETITKINGTGCVLANDWLLSAEDNARFLATPDGLSLDHEFVGEYKTTGRAYDFPPLRHVRQMQWQMYVAGASRCVYAWMLRVGESPSFYAGWLEPQVLWVDRDEKIIEKLVTVARDLLEAIDKE
jgi:hypothetical protein